MGERPESVDTGKGEGKSAPEQPESKSAEKPWQGARITAALQAKGAETEFTSRAKKATAIATAGECPLRETRSIASWIGDCLTMAVGSSMPRTTPRRPLETEIRVEEPELARGPVTTPRTCPPQVSRD